MTATKQCLTCIIQVVNECSENKSSQILFLTYITIFTFNSQEYYIDVYYVQIR